MTRLVACLPVFVTDMVLRRLQNRYILFGLLILPFAPFLYAQGVYTRLKVGRLPDACGEPDGSVKGGTDTLRLLAIGESTVAGVGVKRLEHALGGRFACHLGQRTGASVEWHSLGTSGITIRKTIEMLLPLVPDRHFNVVVIALGGNDVFALRSPVGFRRDLSELLAKVRSLCPDADIFIANVPMIRDCIALPNPLKYVLSSLAKLHHFNVIDLVSGMDNVFYFDDVKKVGDEFFADGIHPSAKGYDDWAREMADVLVNSSERLCSGENTPPD